MNVHEISLVVPSTPSTQTISLSAGVSAQSSALSGKYALVLVTEFAFVVFGDAPTATTSCLPLAPGVHYRVTGWKSGQKLAFISASSAVAYVTENA